MKTSEQLDQWVKGNPIHNEERGECTPDFSCCRGIEVMAGEDVRKRFAQAFYDDDQDAQHKMLMMFLGASLQDYGGKVYLAGDTEGEYGKN